MFLGRTGAGLLSLCNAAAVDNDLFADMNQPENSKAPVVAKKMDFIGYLNDI